MGPSLFYVVWLVFVRRRRVSFFFLLLLFRRWGNTSRAAVCGSPCVVPAALLVFDPFTFVCRYIKAYRPHQFFFFFLFVVSPLVVGFGLSGGGGPLSLSLSLSLSAVRLAMHVCLLPKERGGGLPDGAPSYDHNCLGFFKEMSMGQCPGRSVQNCPCSPHFSLQPSKTEAGRGSWGATVLSDKCFCTIGGRCSSPLTKGEMLLVFFICVFLWSGSCPLPFIGKVLFFLGSACAINFRERTFGFALFSVPCVFGVDLPMVFEYFCNFAPEVP